LSYSYYDWTCLSKIKNDYNIKNSILKKHFLNNNILTTTKIYKWYEFNYVKDYYLSENILNFVYKIIDSKNISNDNKLDIIKKIENYLIFRYKIEILKENNLDSIKNYNRSKLVLKLSLDKIKK